MAREKTTTVELRISDQRSVPLVLPARAVVPTALEVRRSLSSGSAPPLPASAPTSTKTSRSGSRGRRRLSAEGQRFLERSRHAAPPLRGLRHVNRRDLLLRRVTHSRGSSNGEKKRVEGGAHARRGRPRHGPQALRRARLTPRAGAEHSGLRRGCRRRPAASGPHLLPVLAAKRVPRHGAQMLPHLRLGVVTSRPPLRCTCPGCRRLKRQPVRDSGSFLCSCSQKLTFSSRFVCVVSENHRIRAQAGV